MNYCWSMDKGIFLFLLELLFPFWVLGQGQGDIEVVSQIASSYQSYNTASQVALSDEGEVVVGWRSARGDLPFNNVFLQKVNQSGQFMWEGDGTPVCPNPANQDHFRLVSDGYGGVVVVWEDFRKGSDFPLIYAQRVNLRGEALWGKGGLQICKSKGGQWNPQIVSDQKDGFYLVWQDEREGVEAMDLYGQHIDLGGNRHWRVDGLPICTAPRAQAHFRIVADENQDLFIAWEDFRNGVYWNLFGQKIDLAGNYKWEPGGLDIFAGVEENHHRPDIVPDGLGGLLFVYQKFSSESQGTDIYRGRLNAGGELLFHFSTCYSQDEQLNPRIVRKGSKAILVWEDRRYGNWDVYAQMIRLRDGILEWGINGVPVVKTAADERTPVVISSASYNYQVFSWLRGDLGKQQIYVQKLDNVGQRQWELEGKQICGVSTSQSEPAILPDDSGGLWCSWTDRRAAGSADVFVQHINGSSKTLFPKSGLRLAADHISKEIKLTETKIISSRDGNFFLAWEDYRNGQKNPDIYLQKLDPVGKPIWRRGGIPICLAPGEQNRPVLVEDGVGGVIVAWADRRNNTDDNIYAQRVNPWGKVLWERNGVLVCGAPSSQSQIQGVSDGKEGILLAWVDARSLASTGFDLYIQRVDHSGESLWTKDGKPFARFSGLQSSPVLETDGLGGAYIAWMDSRGSFSNIYVQHIDNFGIYTWEYGGRCLAPATTNQRHPEMVRNFQDDLYIVWQEDRYRDGREKLVMQCITPNGSRLWKPEGTLVCNFPGHQATPKVATDKNGNFWVAWLDERSKLIDGVQLRIQKFDMGGNAMWEEAGIEVGNDLEEFNDFEFVLDVKGFAHLIWTQKMEPGKGKSLYSQTIRPDGEKLGAYFGDDHRQGSQSQIHPDIATNVEGRVTWVYIAKKDGKTGKIIVH